ncbi:MAG: hypothetical protein ACOYM7_05405, partial [Paludibacter sp.]
LNYTVPKRWIEKMKIQSVRFNVQAQNLLTLSPFKNGDPEVSNGAAGADANITPGNIGLNSGLATLNFGVSVVF